MKVTIRNVEKGFVIFTLILLTDALSLRSLYVLSEGNIDNGSTISPFDSSVAMAQYVIFAITVSLLIQYSGQFLTGNGRIRVSALFYSL